MNSKYHCDSKIGMFGTDDTAIGHDLSTSHKYLQDTS